jgi:hypothetical protein
MTRKQPARPTLFEPLSGDESGKFELSLVRACATNLEENLARALPDDDFVFQSHLRFLAALYYFLGGAGFEASLAERMRRRTADETISRWINGQSAPAPSVRADALSAAVCLLKDIELQRRIGATLYDLTSNARK